MGKDIKEPVKVPKVPETKLRKASTQPKPNNTMAQAIKSFKKA